MAQFVPLTVAHAPRMPVELLVLVVKIEDVAGIVKSTEVPAARVMVARLSVTAGVVPLIRTIPPPARVVPLKLWLFPVVDPVMVRVPLPMVRPAAPVPVGSILLVRLSGAVLKPSRTTPWLIVVLPV